jgi:hypothetical protein
MTRLNRLTLEYFEGQNTRKYFVCCKTLARKVVREWMPHAREHVTVVIVTDLTTINNCSSDVAC